MSLNKKSIHQLRGIAQSYSIPDIFSMDANHLIQAIQLKQQEAVPAPTVQIEQPQYDARLMTKPPARLSDEQSIRDILAPYVAMGMKLSFDHERWYMAHDKRTDEGTLRMPLRVVLRCAEQLMK